MKLYFAYGSNLHKRQMKWRCPKAVAVGAFFLDDAKLVFRGVADVVYSKGSRVPGGLWLITDECEASLDRYEGVAGGMYRKVEVQLTEPIRGHDTIMFYVMNSEGIMPPSMGYLATIREGYRNFGLKQKPLRDAVEASHDEKNPSHIERQRYARNGRPPLAERPSLKGKAPQKPATCCTQLSLDVVSRVRNALCVYGD